MGERPRARGALIALVGAFLITGLLVSWQGRAGCADVPASAAAADTVRDLPALLARMEGAYAGVTDYTARFARREVVGGRQRPAEEALLKFQRPGRIYLRWTNGPPRGREILFVPGRDGEHALVHEPGIVSGRFTILMAPDHWRVLAESRHAITDVGMGRLVELFATNVRQGMAAGEVQLVDHGNDGPRRRIELVFPRDAVGRYYGRRVRATFRDGLPVAATIYDFDDRAVAEYAYDDLRLNPGLTDADFDPANPAYGFPRLRLSL